MPSSRGKCRARAETPDGNPQGKGCRASVDCIVLQRHASDENPLAFSYFKVGLCKHHTQQWLNWLAGKADPVLYVPHEPQETVQLEDVPAPEPPSGRRPPRRARKAA